MSETKTVPNYVLVKVPEGHWFDHFYAAEYFDGGAYIFYVPSVFAHGKTKINGKWYDATEASTPCRGVPLQDYYTKQKEHAARVEEQRVRSKEHRLAFSAGARRFTQLKNKSASRLQSLPMAYASAAVDVYTIDGLDGHWAMVRKEGIEAVYVHKTDQTPRVMYFKKITNLDVSNLKIV